MGDHCGSSREEKKDEGSSVDLCINSPCSSLAGHSAEHEAVLGRSCKVPEFTTMAACNIGKLHFRASSS